MPGIRFALKIHIDRGAQRCSWLINFSPHRHATHIQIRLRVPAWGPAGFFDLGAENDRVVEGDVVGQDELGTFEVVVEVGLFGILDSILKCDMVPKWDINNWSQRKDIKLRR
jgi:hypothetical protein